MMFKALLVILGVLVQHSTCTYNYNTTVFLPLFTNITAIAMSDVQRNNRQLNKVDIALGTSNGSVILMDSQNISNSYSTYSMMSGSIQWMDWSAGGIFMATQQTAQIVNPFDITTRNIITKTEPINNAVHAYRQFQKIVVIALSLSNRIQIYQNTILVMNITTVTIGKKTMCLDKTGKYLYYFSNNYRYVVSIVGRNVFQQTLSGSNHISLAASSRLSYQDITASVSQTGTLTIWDDYAKLYSYGIGSSQMVIFSQNSDYLITYQPQNIILRATSFSSNIGAWTTEQTLYQSSYQIVGMVAKNKRLIVVPKLFNNNNQLIVYQRQYGSSQVILFIIVGIAIVVILIGVGQCIKNKCNRNNINQFNNQGFNNNSYSQPSSYQPPTYQPQPYQPQPYQPQPYSNQSQDYFGNNVKPNSQNPYGTS